MKKGFSDSYSGKGYSHPKINSCNLKQLEIPWPCISLRKLGHVF